MPQEPTAPIFLRQPRKKNYKRILTAMGYIHVWMGKGHHLADKKGYAYEHRVIAEQKLGRRLEPGEVVHHKDENKQNNDPDNLEVMAGIAEHLFLHRKEGCERRLPGEDNPEISCACGCDQRFLKFDELGRPREYVSGHNPMPSPILDLILGLIDRCGTMRTQEIILATGLSKFSVGSALTKLKRRGLVSNTQRGRWTRKV